MTQFQKLYSITQTQEPRLGLGKQPPSEALAQGVAGTAAQTQEPGSSPQLPLGPALSPGVMLAPAARPIWSREATRLCPRVALRGATGTGAILREGESQLRCALWPSNAPIQSAAKRTNQGYGQRCVYTGLCFVSGCMPNTQRVPGAEQVVGKYC